MNKRPHSRIIRFLLAVAAAALLTIPAVSSRADAQCEKECRKDYQECCKICEKHVKDPRAQRKCKEEGCSTGYNECLKDCKNTDGR